LVWGQTRELGFEQGKRLEVLHALIYLPSRAHARSAPRLEYLTNILSFKPL
jgi:hypothetical protein